MNTRISRRTLLALTGGAALGVGATGWTGASAQTGVSPHVFAGGQELTWADPWTLNATNRAAEILPDSVALQGGNLGEVVLGYYDSPQSIDDVATAFLTLVAGDPTLAQIIAGGEGETVGAGGVVEGTSAYQVYSLTLGEETWGFYVELIDEVGVGIFAAPLAAFSTEMVSAQTSVHIDGIGIFGDVDAAEFQEYLNDAAPTAAGGEYTDDSGYLHVTWTAGWTEVAHNDVGVQVTNPDNTVVLYISGYPVDGKSWQELADADVAFLYDDQGTDVTLLGPTVIETGFSFITDGEFGPRFAQGTATENPDLYVLTFAADFPADSDPATALVLVQEAQAAVMVNGSPALAGLEDLV